MPSDAHPCVEMDDTPWQFPLTLKYRFHEILWQQSRSTLGALGIPEAYLQNVTLFV